MRFRTVFGEQRCIMVDEIDGATMSAQSALRALMEDHLATDQLGLYRQRLQEDHGATAVPSYLSRLLLRGRGQAPGTLCRN